jgi:hypothetical protein
MKIEEVFRKLKPIAEKDMDLLWQEYILADSKTRKSIEEALHIIMADNLEETYEERNILLEPPPKEIASGDYPLGFVFYGKDRFHPFGLREDEFIQHIGVFGRSGSGKTNAAFIIVLNLLRKKKPFLIFDWKRNYRDLLSLIPEEEILVFTVGRSVSPFYFNPLIPPEGSQPKIWLKKIIEIMAHSYFLGEGVSYLLQKAIDTVYREFGIYEGNSGIYPNMNDVKSLLENYKAKGREASWMDSALRAVGVLCFGEVGNVLNQRVNLPMNELLKKNVILELDALTNSDKTFLIESLLLWIHHFRMAEGIREKLKHIIMIEEAHHVLLRRKQEVMGEEAVTDIILREIRELGESIILIDQHPSLISKPALGNTYCTIAMNLKHRSDIAMIADCMLLDTKRTRYLGKLEIGTAMVKLQGRWFEPFMVRFPLVKVNKGSMDDEMIKERMTEFCRDKFSYLDRRSDYTSQKQEKEVFRDFRGKVKEEKTETKNLPEQTDSLQQGEILMLKDIVKHRFSSTSERYRRLGLNAYQGNKSRIALIEKGLIEIRDLPIRTGRVKIFELTDKGKDILSNLGVEINASRRKGGVEHEYWKNRAAEHLKRKGYRVIEEYSIGEGKAVDLVAMRDGKKIAIEIETGKSDAIYNIQKDLRIEFSSIFCLVLDQKLKHKLDEMISNLGLDIDRLQIMEINRFLNIDFFP